MRAVLLLIVMMLSMSANASSGVLKNNALFMENIRKLEFSGTLSTPDSIDLSAYDDQLLNVTLKFRMPADFNNYPEDFVAETTVTTVAHVTGNASMKSHLRSVDRSQTMRVRTYLQNGTVFTWDVLIMKAWYVSRELICANGMQAQLDVSIEVSDEQGVQLVSVDATSPMDFYASSNFGADDCEWKSKMNSGRKNLYLFEQVK